MAQQNGQKEQPKQNFQDDREWITEAQFNRTVERFNAGEKDIIDKVLKTFKMRRELKEQLLKIKGGNNNG